jgi:hypothetical protein
LTHGKHKQAASVIYILNFLCDGTEITAREPGTVCTHCPLPRRVYTVFPEPDPREERDSTHIAYQFHRIQTPGSDHNAQREREREEMSTAICKVKSKKITMHCSNSFVLYQRPQRSISLLEVRRWGPGFAVGELPFPGRGSLRCAAMGLDLRDLISACLFVGLS